MPARRLTGGRVCVAGLPAVLVVIVVAADKNSYGLQEYGGEAAGDGSSEL